MPRHPAHPEGDVSPDELAERALQLLRPPPEGEVPPDDAEPPRDQDLEPPPPHEEPQV